MSRVQTQTQEQTKSGSIAVRGSYIPLQRNGSLDKYENFEVTPAIGQEFDKTLQLSEILKASNSDELLKDLAVLVSQRNVVFFRDQDIDIADQQILGTKLGEWSGKPKSSTLHRHPLTEERSPKGDEISVITSERRGEYLRGDPSRIASLGWHSDITFEPVPSDYAILKVHTNPAASGGDTLWSSAYELYDRLSPEFAKFLSGLQARHEAPFFHQVAKGLGNQLRTGTRGSPANSGDDLSAIHPVIRTNPVTGWNGVFVNKTFTKRILGVTKDESDFLIDYLTSLNANNHDLQVRFRWGTKHEDGRGDIAIWDNRSTFHSATWDYEKQLRVGDRVVSIGEKPYFDREHGKSRRDAIGQEPHGPR